jgi:hypothetical protein
MMVKSLPSSLARASGAVIALRISAFSRATMSGGSFAGPKNPNQVDGLRIRRQATLGGRSANVLQRLFA